MAQIEEQNNIRPLITMSAVYVGKDYPNLTKGQEYKLYLQYAVESSYHMRTSHDDEELMVSGIADLVNNFTQICKL